MDERLNGEDGLGAIYPAMAYALMMYDVARQPQGRSALHPDLEGNRQVARRERG